MSSNSSNANINVTVDARQAQQAVKQLGDEVKKLSVIMGQLTQQQNSLSSFSTAVGAVAKQLQTLNLVNNQTNQQLNAAVGSYDAAKKRLKDLEEQIKAAAGGFNSMSPAVKQMVGEYNKLGAEVKKFDGQLGNSGKAFETFKKSIDEVIKTGPKFGESLEDGLKAVLEKLPDLMEGYKGFREENQALQAQGQPTKSVFSQLVGSLGSWNAAINIGVTLIANYGEVTLKWVRSLITGQDAVDKTKEKTESLNKALSTSEYTKAIENVNELTSDIKLAKDGFVDKEKVLEHYNETLGKTTGKANSLDEAEQLLKKNSAKYIQMTLDKAAANAALEMAAKKAAEAQQERLKKPQDDIGLMDYAKVVIGFDKNAKTTGDKIKAGVRSIIRVVSGEGVIDATKDYFTTQKKITAEAQDRLNTSIKEKEDESAKFMSAFNEYRDKAAKEYKAAGGDLLDDGADKGGKSTGKSSQESIKEKRKQAAAQAEEILKTSQAQQLLIATDGYAQQMMAAEKHFKEELDKLKSSYANKLITKDTYEKAAFQLLNERQAATQNVIDTFNKEDKEKTLALSNELIELQIAAMAEGAEKQIDEINHQTKLKTQALDKQKEELSDTISKGDASVKALLDSGDGAAAAVEQTHLESLRAQLDALEEKRKLLVAAGGKAVDDVRKAQEDQKRAAKNKATADLDEVAVNDTNKPGHAAEHFKALMTQLEHRKQAELENTKLTVEEKKKIISKYDMDKAALEKTEHDRKLNEAIQTEEKIRSTAMNMLGGALKQASEARLRQLSQDKALELSNTSLTKSQKKAIEDKYKKLELQEKQRAFKQEQKMQIANAVMAGAVAVVKDLGSPWKIAFDIAMTAAQVATILKQKAPAYATGGLHYASDGRGALLSGPGSGTSDSMNARLSNGEAVINARSTGMYGDLLSAINVAGGGRPFGSYWGSAFAGGGTMGNTYLPTRNNPARMNLPLLASPTIDYDRLASSMTKVSLVLDVKDVNREQANLARAVNGSSH